MRKYRLVRNDVSGEYKMQRDTLFGWRDYFTFGMRKGWEKKTYMYLRDAEKAISRVRKEEFEKYAKWLVVE